MIEPQNTVFPVPADPTAVPEAEGDSAGFGAMLAQSLGLAAPLDQAAIQQLGSGNHQQNQPEDGDILGDTDQAAPDVVDPVSSQPMPTPVGPVPTSTRLEIGTEPVPIERVPVVEDNAGLVPDAGETASAQPTSIKTDPTVPSAPDLPPAVQGQVQDVADGVRAEAHVPTTDQGSEPAKLVAEAKAAPYSIGNPVAVERGNDSPQPVVAPAVADATSIAEPEIAHPEQLESVPTMPPGRTAPPTPPSESPTLGPEPAPAAPAAVPRPAAQVDPMPTESGPVADQTAPMAPVAADTPAAPAPEATPQVSVPTPAPGDARVNLPREAPVMLEPTRPVAASTKVEAAPVPTSVAESGPIPAPVAFEAPLANSSQIAAPSNSAGVLPSQTSALAERVMQAVDLQRTQPPPRSMIVEIPEIEGLRLVVSVRSGGHVSVTQAGGGANADAFTPFAADLSRVLSERGFVMNGEDRRGRHYQQMEGDAAPRRAARPTFRRPARNDNDLRI